MRMTFSVRYIDNVCGQALKPVGISGFSKDDVWGKRPVNYFLYSDVILCEFFCALAGSYFGCWTDELSATMDRLSQMSRLDTIWSIDEVVGKDCKQVADEMMCPSYRAPRHLWNFFVQSEIRWNVFLSFRWSGAMPRRDIASSDTSVCRDARNSTSDSFTVHTTVFIIDSSDRCHRFTRRRFIIQS